MIDRYRSFCEGNPDVPIFMQPWWLDIVCEGAENWDAVMVEKGGSIQGIMPFFLTKKFGSKGIAMPLCTPFMGHKIYYPDQQKYSSRISFENKVVAALLSQLPRVSFFQQHFSTEVTNWLPYHWERFEQTTRYFYVLQDISKTDEVFEGFEHHTRQAIRKAAKFTEISSVNSVVVMIELLKKTFARRKEPFPYSINVLEKLWEACSARSCASLIVAKDKLERIHAVRFLVRDGDKVYNLLCANDPELQTSGAQSLLIWHAIQEYSGQGIRTFDFSGSMMPGIENFIRGFGGQLVPYFRITKENSIPYFWLGCANDFKNRFLVR